MDKNRKPHTLEELKAKINREIDCISEIELIRVNNNSFIYTGRVKAIRSSLPRNQ